MKRTLFITGTDTGVGKTVLTCLLARYLRSKKLPAAALKPICSGGRDDARCLVRALDKALPLDAINPWHFRAPISPLLAARQENKKVHLNDVLAFIRQAHEQFPILVVEGAGGLLSPLGEDFDSRDLVVGLRAIPVVVCPNRLGAINQARLVLEALPPRLRASAHIVLSTQRTHDAANSGNIALLSELLGAERVHLLPRLQRWHQLDRALKSRNVRKVMDALANQASP